MESLFWISLGILFYAYLGYPLVLAWFASVFKKRVKKREWYPKVSQVIAAYNEAPVIAAKLENSLSLDYPRDRLQIIVASDGSDDGTNEIVRGFEDQGVVLHAYGERRGKVSAISDSAERADGEIILFSDSNDFYEGDVLKVLIPYFADETVGAVGGWSRIREEHRTGHSQGLMSYWDYELFVTTKQGELSTALGCDGTIYALRKALFVRPPHDTILDDDYIPQAAVRQGYRVIIDPRAVAWTESLYTSRQILREKIRTQAGMFQLLGYHRSLLNPLQGRNPLRAWTAYNLFSHRILRLFTPLLLLGLFVSSAFLAGPFYRAAFWAQIAFLGCGVLGRLLSTLGIRFLPFSIAQFFLVYNLSVIAGFLRHATGTQKVTWKRVRKEGA
jgi:cellulose synthase/poly-beta-1,6-N-acetylglucosamine synthase-like glycosyltransferase